VHFGFGSLRAAAQRHAHQSAAPTADDLEAAKYAAAPTYLCFSTAYAEVVYLLHSPRS